MMFTYMFYPNPNEIADILWKGTCLPSKKKKNKNQERSSEQHKLEKMSTSPKRVNEENTSNPVTSPMRNPTSSPSNGMTRPSMSNGDEPSRRPNSSRFLRNNRNILLGPLPTDFLRIDEIERQRQIDEDEQTARAIASQQSLRQPGEGPVLGHPGYAFRTILSPTVPMPPIVGRLDLMILEAKLVKNYGLTRMDPYVRIRFGMSNVYESQTAVNGGKNPRWNKTFHVFLPEGQESFHLQIMDEKTFSDDEEIAYLHYELTDEVMKQGKTKEEWVDLQGRQGKEGIIGMVIKFTPISATASANLALTTPAIPLGTELTQVAPGVSITPAPVTLTRGAAVPPVYVNRSQGPPVPPLVIPEEDINQIKDMFPSVDVEVIKTLFENERGNKDRVINDLLSMSNN